MHLRTGLAFGAALFMLSPAVPFTGAATPPAPPSFLFILVDDLGWADLGCYGSSSHHTPHLDMLAASGMRFTDAYAACPVCSPTRASILTGRYPARVGITDWIPGQSPKNRKLTTPEDRHQLALEELTIAEALKTVGYRTFFAGKWHLGSTGFSPEDQGFEINKGGHHKGSPPGGYYAPYKNPALPNGPDGEYLPDRLTDETIAFIKSAQHTPFLAYLAFYTVHTPIQACKRHLPACEERIKTLGDLPGPAYRKERNGMTRLHQDNAAFASMVHAMDENVGRLLAALEAEGLADNTVVIFTSDNGGLSTLGRKGAPTSNEPLRAGKGWCYEGGIREPLIVRAPGLTTPGSTCAVPVTSTDFFPTLWDLAGQSPDRKHAPDGISLVPLFTGKPPRPREAIYWHYPHYHGSMWAPGAAIRAGNWKLIEFYEEERAELYDLARDISETTDLSMQHPAKKAELRRLLKTWQQQIGARMPTPNPAFKKANK